MELFTFSEMGWIYFISVLRRKPIDFIDLSLCAKRSLEEREALYESVGFNPIFPILDRTDTYFLGKKPRVKSNEEGIIFFLKNGEYN